MTSVAGSSSYYYCIAVRQVAWDQNRIPQNIHGEVAMGVGYVNLSILVITTWIISQCDSQVGAQPIVSGASWVNVGMNTTLQCAPTSPNSLRLLQWRNSSFDVTDFRMSDIIIDFTPTPTDTVVNRDPAHYTFSKDDPSYPLTINTVTLDDEARYWCNVNAAIGGREDDSFDVHIRVPLSTVAITYDGTSYSNNGDSFWVVAGNVRQFTCTTPGINPAAVFTWNLVLGSTSQPQGSQTNTSNTGDSRLTDSTSTITVDIPEGQATGQLTCGATNRQDGQTGTEMDIAVNLQVEVTPKVSSMSLSGFIGNTNGSVDQGRQQMIQCMVPGTRPAATIEWYLGGVNQTSGTSTTSQAGQNNLIDTTGSWTFTPSRSNHDEEVRCEARTPKSQAPSVVMVSLKVNGPPDPPVITGVTSPIMEGVEINLTCEADMGYPEDWCLDWANGGSGITGPSTTSSLSSGSRYKFSSTWDFTPHREDNGNNITCTANKTSWTPGPVGSLGPIDVRFCARFVTFTGCLSTIAAGNMVCCPSAVTAGNMVSFTCTSGSSNPASTLTLSRDSDDVTGPTDESIPGDHGGRVTTITYSTGVLNKTNNGDVYMCCATNAVISSCTTPLCQTCILNVEYPPDFTSETQTPQTPINEGKDVNLTCIVDANPSTVDITWKKEGSGDAFNPTSGVTSTLTLSNINREQAGYYTCTANNGVPTDNPTDVVSSPITVIVYYEVNITNKAMDKEGVNDGDTAVLTCIAVGNPQPVMVWYGPNTTGIISDTDEGKFLITNETSGGDGVFELEVTSKLTIKAVDSLVDYGVYTCISSNGIGREDSLNITLTGTRRPDEPTRVVITEQTAESLTVGWTPGYDGGETQSFRVSCIKTSDSTEVFTEETGGKTTSTATGLDDYTEYEIRVYAKNAIGENDKYGSTNGYTLPNPPGPGSGITVKYDEQGGTVEVGGLKEGKGCIQLEVKYEGNGTWQKCGACISSNQKVTLSEWCAPSQKRRRRAVGDIEAVRAKTCFNDFCSEPAAAEIVVPVAKPTDAPTNIALIVGASVGGVVLVAIIAVLIGYLVRTSPKRRSGKEDSLSCANEVELQEPSHDAQPEENNGITNEALLNNATYAQVNKDKKATGPLVFRPKKDADVTDTYAQVNKTKLPPKPQSARSAPTNLPDVTYAEVNKNNKPKPPPDDYAAKKKPKKYVPPSSRAAEESAYEEVQISDKDKAKSPPAADSADTYASVGGQQDTSGRVVTEDGLIYAEVGHMKQHPVDQPPIQTEESTEYASLDFARMKPEDK